MNAVPKNDCVLISVVACAGRGLGSSGLIELAAPAIHFNCK
jgi:hypothetical protein